MNKTLKKILLRIPYVKSYHQYLCTKLHYISFPKFVIYQLFGSRLYWWKDKSCVIGCERNIFVGKNSNIGREISYIQGKGWIYIGNYVIFGPNIGILSTNHDLYDQNKSNEKPIIIHDYCWLGMGVKVMAGVELGPRTIVGAGSVVTKSFPEGYCVIAGIPAKVVKNLDKEKFIPWHYQGEFYGFYQPEHFKKHIHKYIDIDNSPIKDLIFKNLG